jgi:hypothetical protein
MSGETNIPAIFVHTAVFALALILFYWLFERNTSP